MYKKSLREATSIEEARAILRERKSSQVHGSAGISEGSPQVVVVTTHAVSATLGQDMRRSQRIIVGGVVIPQDEPMSEAIGFMTQVTPEIEETQGADGRKFFIGNISIGEVFPESVGLPEVSRETSGREESPSSEVQIAAPGEDSIRGDVPGDTPEAETPDIIDTTDTWVGGTTDGLIREMQVAIAKTGISSAVNKEGEKALMTSQAIMDVDILVRSDQMGIVEQPTRSEILNEVFFPRNKNDFNVSIDKDRLVASKSDDEKYGGSFITVHLPHATEPEDLFFRYLLKNPKVKGRHLVFLSRTGNRYLISGEYNSLDGMMQFYPEKKNTTGPKEPFFGRIIGQPHY